MQALFSSRKISPEKQLVVILMPRSLQWVLFFIQISDEEANSREAIWTHVVANE